MKGVKMMKIKFLTLTAFMLCLVMLLASCGAEETANGNENETGVCAETVDADNDGKCDNCGHDAALPKEEIPVMVVKPVPENSNADEYFVFNYDGEEVPFSKYTSLTGNIELNDAINGGRIVVLKYSNSVSAAGAPTEQQMMKDYYNIYDLEANQSIYFFASSEYLNGTSPKETYTFGCGDYYVCHQSSRR
jgi:hypothetical protein